MNDSFSAFPINFVDAAHCHPTVPSPQDFSALPQNLGDGAPAIGGAVWGSASRNRVLLF
jgi:hypothetical protein